MSGNMTEVTENSSSILDRQEKIIGILRQFGGSLSRRELLRVSGFSSEVLDEVVTGLLETKELSRDESPNKHGPTTITFKLVDVDTDSIQPDSIPKPDSTEPLTVSTPDAATKERQLLPTAGLPGSVRVKLSKSVLHEAGISGGQAVEISVRGNEITIKGIEETVQPEPVAESSRPRRLRFWEKVDLEVKPRELSGETGLKNVYSSEPEGVGLEPKTVATDLIGPEALAEEPVEEEPETEEGDLFERVK